MVKIKAGAMIKLEVSGSSIMVERNSIESTLITLN